MNEYLMVDLSNNSKLTSETADMLDLALTAEQKIKFERWLRHAKSCIDIKLNNISRDAQMKRMGRL